MVAVTELAAPARSPPAVGTCIDNGTLELIEILGYRGYGVIYCTVNIFSPDTSQGAPKTIKIEEVFELEEFNAIFTGKGRLIQPTPENKPKSTMTIMNFVQVLFGDELKALKGNCSVKWPYSRKRNTEHQCQLHLREMMLHQLASAHPNVITLHCIIEDFNYTYLVVDYCPDGDLFTQILHNPRFQAHHDREDEHRVLHGPAHVDDTPSSPMSRIGPRSSSGRVGRTQDPMHFLSTLLPISEEVNLLLSQILEVDWRRRIMLREMRLSIVDTDSESSEEEPEPEPEPKELPEVQDESMWSNDSESEMAFATQSVMDKSSWAYLESYTKRDSYAQSMSPSPDSPLFTTMKLFEMMNTPSAASPYLILSSSPSIPSLPVIPEGGESLQPEESQRPKALTLCNVRSIRTWPTLHAIPDVNPAPALFSEELIPRVQDSSSLYIPGYWIVRSAPGRKMMPEDDLLPVQWQCKSSSLTAVAFSTNIVDRPILLSSMITSDPLTSRSRIMP
ncbi:hypothetical protein SCP_0301130 [Sparassis crispa]|uniref:Protein kinase domain-containing protein n=1 Tax=Sparassis crispa TaxID=139825 RepID=A0A401GDY3_9APHY|nr:hypothetical protein SCP_0301130 [Sparassis crispa]GBE80398.1 hypothetical protein SCP_0301130 [Sparassis crispa]